MVKPEWPVPFAVPFSLGSFFSLNSLVIERIVRFLVAFGSFRGKNKNEILKFYQKIFTAKRPNIITLIIEFLAFSFDFIFLFNWTSIA